MSEIGFIKEMGDAQGDVKELEELEKVKMKKYQDSKITNADFEVTYVGWIAEEELMKGDKEKRKNLHLQNKTGQLVVLGLNNTSLLNTINNDPFARYSTLCPSSEELIMGNIKFTAFDLSGSHAQAGRVWKDYFPVVDSIVFLVDATDRRRFAEAKAELESLLTDEQVANALIAILGTKSDLREAVNEERLCDLLGLSSATNAGIVDHRNINDRQVKLFMCNTKEQASFGQAFRWLARFLKDM